MSLIYPDGFEWDTYALGKRDLGFLVKYIKTNNIKNLLEVGCGLSSLLLSQVCDVTTLENNPEWSKKVRSSQKEYHDLFVVDWNGKDWPAQGPWDAVFIDGPEELDPDIRKTMPYVGLSREVSFQNAVDITDRILVHDARRVAEMVFQISYLAPNFHITDIVRSDDDDKGRYLTAWKRVKT